MAIPVPVDEIIDFMDHLASLCLDEKDKEELMEMALSTISHLTELKVLKGNHSEQN